MGKLLMAQVADKKVDIFSRFFRRILSITLLFFTPEIWNLTESKKKLLAKKLLKNY